MNTAKAEDKTPSVPLTAQYQGVSPSHAVFTICIPVGKATPRKRPSGIIITIEAAIFKYIGDVIIHVPIKGIINRTAIMIMAMAAG